MDCLKFFGSLFEHYGIQTFVVVVKTKLLSNSNLTDFSMQQSHLKCCPLYPIGIFWYTNKLGWEVLIDDTNRYSHAKKEKEGVGLKPFESWDWRGYLSVAGGK